MHAESSSPPQSKRRVRILISFLILDSPAAASPQRGPSHIMAESSGRGWFNRPARSWMLVAMVGAVLVVFLGLFWPWIPVSLSGQFTTSGETCEVTDGICGIQVISLPLEQSVRIHWAVGGGGIVSSDIGPRGGAGAAGLGV